MADFLLGIASSYNQGDSQRFYNRNKYAGLFAQDNWRMQAQCHPELRFRWDVMAPWSEKYNQLQTLVLGEQSRVYPGAPAGLVFPGDPGVPRTLAPIKYDNFAPRIGVSYSPDRQNGLLAKIFGGPGKTSIRAGYGLFYTAFEGLSAGIMSANPPYGYDYTSLAPPLFCHALCHGGERPECRPALPVNVSLLRSFTASSRFKCQLVAVPSDHRRAFFLSRECAALFRELHVFIATGDCGEDLLSVSYVGTQAHHLLVLTSANPGNPALCLSLSQPNEVMPGTPTCGHLAKAVLTPRLRARSIQGTRGPFSSKFAAVTYQKTIANSNYNALQINLHRTLRTLGVHGWIHLQQVA
jgi:hypothetical protein